MKLSNIKIKISGIVQSVGMRPAVYNCAVKHNIKGYVINSGTSVYIEAENTEENLKNFLDELLIHLPKNSLIENVSKEYGQIKYYTSFEIKESKDAEGDILISPDIAVCENCKKEFDCINDRRHEYAFINCTDCGPRFSIINNTPYDRKNTSMKFFSMCEDCKKEYTEPNNRRYHAEPVCCPLCGPKLYFDSSEDNPIIKAVSYIKNNKIIAVKGIGGYHISCNAKSKTAVRLLRERKHRYGKPLAVMVRDIVTAEKLAEIGKKEKKLLSEKEAPIVLLTKSENYDLADNVAPDTERIGIMLPYAPVHYLLFKYLDTDTLVMTSGNISDEPIACDDEDAFNRLKDICDGFLWHKRKIINRIDDSVLIALNNNEYFIRRARGYVPKAINIKIENRNNKQILACGSLLKNTFCLVKNNRYYLSSHIGDLEEGISFDYYLEQIELYKKLFRISPNVCVCDTHPDYINSLWARGLDISVKELQHHRAHAISSMADSGLENAICVTYDGTGYGKDGTVWGGEIFVGNIKKLTRVAHIKPVTIFGANTFDGEKISPFKCLIPYLDENDEYVKINNLYDELIILKTLNNINSFETTSMGRFFDAVSGLVLNIKEISFEAQAPMMLEYIADKNTDDIYDFTADNYILDQYKIIEEIKKDIKKSVMPSIISGKFHNTVAVATIKICEKISEQTGIKDVCLSGGVFQNILLVKKIIKYNNKLKINLNRKVPVNDGGISFGQAVWENITEE